MGCCFRCEVKRWLKREGHTTCWLSARIDFPESELILWLAKKGGGVPESARARIRELMS